MREYEPSLPFATPVYLLKPKYVDKKGVSVKTFPEPTADDLLYVNFKTYGGTETTINGTYALLNTAVIETWYRPDIKADCRIRLMDGSNYDVKGKPENINMRNQFIKFKVEAVEGGA